MKVVYGVFDNRASADAAVERVDLPARHWNAFVHDDFVREEDVQFAGTEALRGAILGGLVVGIGGALAAVLFIWPMDGWTGAWGAGALMAMAGSLFGVVAGGVAGASECKSPIRDEVGYAEKRGKVVVTCEVDHARDADRVISILEAGGGEHVNAA
jgi:hypothetical protein